MFEKRAQDAVIVSACRTPIGKIRGVFSSVRPDDLLAIAIKEAVARAGIAPGSVDEVFAGCANQAGEDNRNVARMATLLAGLPESVPGVTVNRLCASGLEALSAASRMIQAGEASVVVAGGVESMTRAPFALAKSDGPFPTGTPQVFDTSLGWRFPNPKLEALFPLEQMGETAENLVDELKISRADQDAFAVRSHQRAVAAMAAGQFVREIAPVSIAHKKGDPVVVKDDEGPRKDTTADTLASLKPAFRKTGSVTAGNSSTLNDGAAALVVMSRAQAKSEGKTVLASLRGAASAGVSPRKMGIGPVPAVEKLLARAKVKLADIDAIELNEAFAAQALAVIRTLGLDEERTNRRGGAIALGHPLGASGARIVVTLLSILADEKKTLGLATLCVGVGQGLAMLVEREA